MKQQQQKSKRYYSRISKKKYKTQKGGAAAAAHIAHIAHIAPTINATELQQELMPFRTDPETFFLRAVELLSRLKHFKLIELITKVFTKLNGTQRTYPMFDIDKSMSGPLIEMQNNPGFMTTEPPTPETSYLEWYKQYNPEFKPIGELPADKLQFTVKLKGVEVPIFETLIAQICRDACFMILTGKKNIDNQYRSKNVRLKSREYAEKKRNFLLKTNKQNLARDYILQIAKHSEYDKLNNSQNISVLANNISSKRTQLIRLLEICNKCATINNYLDVIEMLCEYISVVSRSKEFFEELKNSVYLPYILYPTYTQISYKSVVLLCTAPIINFRVVNRYRSLHHNYGNASNEYMHDVAVHAMFTHGITTTNSDYQERFNIFNKFIKIFYNKFEDQKTIDGKIYAFILFAFLHEDHVFLKQLLNNANLSTHEKIQISKGLCLDAKENKFFEFMNLTELDDSYFLSYLENIITTIKDNIETLKPLLKYLV